MNLSLTDQTLQSIAFLFAAIELSLSLYVLLLNRWHSTNRHVFTLLLVGAITSFGQGLLIGAADARAAALPSYFLTVTVPAITPLQFIVAVILLKPQWLPTLSRTEKSIKWRWVWWLLYVLAAIPLILTLVDLGLNTEFWYTAIDPESYPGGVVRSGEFSRGSLSPILSLLIFQFTPLLTLAFLQYSTASMTAPAAYSAVVNESLVKYVSPSI